MLIQELLKDIESTLRTYNRGLANKNTLVDIPWTLVDGDMNLQRLIFKKDQSMMVVHEGAITNGKWEYVAAMNSIVLEIKGDKTLMNQIFGNETALILKKDGTSTDFIAFANQNRLPDLNLTSYLGELLNDGTDTVNTKTSKYKEEITKETDDTDNDLNYWVFIIVAIMVSIFFLVVVGGAVN